MLTGSGSMRSVSYTHLDVYKRQQIYRRFGKLRVLLFADIDDDMDTDMKEMLSALQNMTFT